MLTGSEPDLTTIWCLTHCVCGTPLGVQTGGGPNCERTPRHTFWMPYSPSGLLLSIDRSGALGRNTDRRKTQPRCPKTCASAVPYIDDRHGRETIHRGTEAPTVLRRASPVPAGGDTLWYLLALVAIGCTHASGPGFGLRCVQPVSIAW